MTNILSQLNPAQQEAVTYKQGPLLVLAGAGSGKTRVLTHRAAYLINNLGVDPKNILLLTFTNKAAEEMKKRMKKLLNTTPNTHLPFAGTFHSFCAKILRADGGEINLSPKFLIFDEQDQQELVKQALVKLYLSPKNFNPHTVLATISQSKNELISHLEYPQYARGHFQETVAKIWLEYQKSLKESEALDFDDLLNEAVRLLQKTPQVLQKYQNHYHHVLVDEWQDTNRAQYTLTRLLAKHHQNLTVVGDCSQSIYGWRGANFRNVMLLQKDFPQIKTVNLEENYRSTQTILDAAHAVIKNNQSHPILKLWTQKNGGDKIGLFEAHNELEEAQFITETILDSRRSQSDFAILYRTNAQSRVIEEAFLHAGLPYLLIGGVKFYSRREVKDVLAYLRYLINSKDSVSKKRIEKLGKGRMKKFQEFNEKIIDKKTLTKIDTLEIMDQVLEATNYLDRYDPQDPDDLARLENIKELRSVAMEFPEIIQFLENVALVEQDSPVKGKNDDRTKGVTLMTAHAAKGLEFPVVFIVGMEEGLFPHSRSLTDKQGLEEERRLCYVGLTRSKEKIFLSYAKRRLYFGQRTANMVSRFIAEIPEGLFESVTMKR